MVEGLVGNGMTSSSPPDLSAISLSNFRLTFHVFLPSEFDDVFQTFVQ